MNKVVKTLESAITDFFIAQNNDLFCICSSDLIISEINSDFATYIGAETQDLINKNLVELLENKNLDSNLSKYLKSNDVIDNHEFVNNIANHSNNSLTQILWRIKFEADLNIYIIHGKKLISKTRNNEVNVQKRLKLLANKISDSFFVFDKDFNITYQNEPAVQTFNHDSFEENSNILFACFPESTNIKFLDHFKRSFEEKEPIQFVEFSTLINKWFFINAVPIDGSLYVLCKDISDTIVEQKTNDLELRVFEMNLGKNKTVEELLTFLLTGLENLHPEIHGCMLKLEDQKLFFMASPRLPTDYTDLLHGLKTTNTESSFGPLALSKKQIIVDDIESSEIWKNHKHLVLPLGFKAWWSFPIISTKANEVMAVFSIYCKTKRKPTEIEIKTILRVANIIKIILQEFKHDDAILLSNNRYEMVTMATNDAIYDWDLIKNKVYWSDNIYNIFGYELTEVDVMENWWANNLHSQDKHNTINNLKACIKERKSGWSAEYRIRCKNGKYKYVYDRAYIIYDKLGNPQTIIGAMQDISILKEREIEILKQNNKLKEIAQISSHELRRPVTSVLGLVGLFNKTDLTDETNKTIIEYLEHATKELDQVIHTIVAKTLEAEYTISERNE